MTPEQWTDSYAVWVSYRQANCHLQEFTQLTGIKLLILRFLAIFASLVHDICIVLIGRVFYYFRFLVPISMGGANARFVPPCGRPWLCVCENEATIYSHHGSAVKLRNTCRRNLAQRWVSWSNSVVPEVSVETQTRWLRVKKWAVPRRSKPELYIFNVATVLSLSVA